MKLEFINPIYELKPYITKIWLFEDNHGFLNHGTLIAPNAKPKIIIPIKNSIATTDSAKTDVCNEGDIRFIGVRDSPVTLSMPQGVSQSIGLEFTSESAYRFLNIPMNEIANSTCSFADLYGKSGKVLLEEIANCEKIHGKLYLLQKFLLNKLLENNTDNQIINYSINFLSESAGLADLKMLEKKTGYSNRYLEILFKRHLGISPKTFATIVRFRIFYKFWSGMANSNSETANIYNFYYDQAHFIKEFKRYTGKTPMQLANYNNDFGKNF